MTKVKQAVMMTEAKMKDAQDKVDRAMEIIRRRVADANAVDMITFLPQYTKELEDAWRELGNLQQQMNIINFIADDLA